MQQAISWRGELTLNGINTAKEFPEWPSKLNGLIKTRGSLYGGTWQMEVLIMKLTGNVKQNKVETFMHAERQQLYAVDDPWASSGTRAKQCRSERRAGERSQS